MKIFLTVLFLVNGELSVVEGYLPREQPSAAECQRRAAAVQDYLMTAPGLPSASIVACINADDMFQAVGRLAQMGGQEL